MCNNFEQKSSDLVIMEINLDTHLFLFIIINKQFRPHYVDHIGPWTTDPSTSTSQMPGLQVPAVRPGSD